jgi:hypothetical protein
MGMHSKWVNGSLVYYDSVYGQRWYDAQGPTVCKFLEDFVETPFASANVPACYNTQNDGGCTLALTTSGYPAGYLLVTTAAGDNDGVNMQAVGEAFLLAADKPCYFGIKLLIEAEASENEFLVGMTRTDTDVITSTASGVYWRKDDGDTIIDFITELATSEVAVPVVAVAAAGTWYILEFIWDGTNLDSWVNGVLQTRVAALTSLPQAVTLTPTIAFRAGEAVLKTYEVAWMRAIQIN